MFLEMSRNHTYQVIYTRSHLSKISALKNQKTNPNAYSFSMIRVNENPCPYNHFVIQVLFYEAFG